MRLNKFSEIIVKGLTLALFFVFLPLSANAQLVPKPSGVGVCVQSDYTTKSTDWSCTAKEGLCAKGNSQTAHQFRTSDDKTYTVECDYTFCDMLGILTGIARLITGSVGGLALLYFVYGAVQLIVSGGSAQKVGKGKEVMTQAVMGLVVVLVAYQLVGIIIVTFMRGQIKDFSSGRLIATPWNLLSTGQCAVSPIQEQAAQEAKRVEEQKRAAPAPGSTPATTPAR